MKKVRCFFSVLFVFLLFSSPEACALSVESSAFSDGERIPDRYTCRGEDISPELSWDGVPENTESFILVVDDPDAPLGTWIHWVVYNIPGSERSLKENVPKTMQLDNGTLQGINSFRWIGYGGPCPPPGPAHRYMFKLYALDTVLELRPGSSKGDVMRAAQGHVLSQATLMGTYSR
ncbi:MAG: YbhB/YbcL family Raf kinase inhibitor-like protein [Candidatus Omnitrophica bacterium]|nr:YbhB/YbcL family Raf kinase inhibitor-like protein [Candidatus Omnitrophota bacterium]